MSLLDLSHTEKPRQIQENLIAYMRLFAALPDVKAEDDSSTFWIVSGSQAPGNYILRAVWQPTGIEEQIDALFRQIGELADSIDWMIYPGDQPADLSTRLEARGMPGKRPGFWLWTDLNALTAPPAVPQGFRIEQVRDDRAMAEWTRLSEAGFDESLSQFHDAYVRHGYGSDAFSLHYTGYLGDIPVTTGTLLNAGGTATIYDLSTPPEFRKQGFGGALTHYLMRQIRARGYSDTWIWASEMARPLYQQLGYIDAEFGMREHTWQRP